MAKQGDSFVIQLDFRAKNLTEITNKLKNITNLVDSAVLIDVNIDQAKLEKLKKDTSIFSKAITDNFNQNTQKMDWKKINADLRKYNVNIDDLRASFDKLGIDGSDAFSKIQRAGLNLDKQMAKTETFMSKLSDTLNNTLRWRISNAALNAISSQLQQAYYFAKDLDASLTNIRIVSGMTANDSLEFAKNANQAAKVLKTSTLEYIDAALIYFQQGLSGDAVQKMTDATIIGANITQQSAQEMSTLYTSVMRGYNMNADQAMMVADKLSAVGATTAADFYELATAMSKVASIANTAGVSIDQVNAQIATVISTTKEAPEIVGNALKSMYSRMLRFKTDSKSAMIDDEGQGFSAPAVEAALKAFSGGDISLFKQAADGTQVLRDMGSVVEDIGNAWEKTGSQEAKMTLVTALAGTHHLNRVMALFNGWEEYKSSVVTSLGAEGTALQQNEIYLTSYEGALKKLQATAEELYMSLIKSDDMKDIVNIFTGFLEVTTKVIDTLGGLPTILTAIAAILSKSVFQKPIAALYSTTSKIKTERGTIGKSILGAEAQTKRDQTVELVQRYATPQQLADLKEEQDLLDKRNSILDATKRRLDIINASAKLVNDTMGKQAVEALRQSNKRNIDDGSGKQFTSEERKTNRSNAVKQLINDLDSIKTNADLRLTETNKKDIEELTTLFADFVNTGKGVDQITEKMQKLNKEVQSASNKSRGSLFGGGEYTEEQASEKYKTDLQDAVDISTRQIKTAEDIIKAGQEVEKIQNRIMNLTMMTGSFTAIWKGGIEDSDDAAKKLLGSLGVVASTLVMNGDEIAKQTSENLKKSNIDSLKADLIPLNEEYNKIKINLKGIGKEGTLAGAKLSAGFKVAAINAKILKVGIMAIGTAMKTVLKSFLPLFIISTVLTAAITKFDELINASEKAIETSQELTQNYKEATNEISNNIVTLESLREEYNKLNAGIDKNGENINLSANEYQRYKDIIKQITDMNPDLIQGYDAEGNAIVKRNGLIDDAIAKQKELNKLKTDEYISGGEEVITGVVEKREKLVNDNARDTTKAFGKLNSKDYEEAIGMTKAEMTLGGDGGFNIKAMDAIVKNREKILSLAEKNGKYNEKDLANLEKSISDMEIYSSQLKSVNASGGRFLSIYAQDTYPDILANLDPTYLDEFGMALNNMTNKYDDYGAMTENTGRVLQEFNKIQGTLGPTVEELQDKYKEDGNVKSYNAAMASQADAVKKLAKTYELTYPTLADFLNLIADGYTDRKKEIDVTEEATDANAEYLKQLKNFTELEKGIKSITNVLDEFKQNGEVSATTINSLATYTDEAGKAVFASLPSFREFSDVMMDENSTAKQRSQVTNKLIGEYLNQSSALKNITKDTKNQVIAELESIGVKNASAIAENALKKAEFDRQLTLTNLNTATDKQIQKLKEMATQLGLNTEITNLLGRAELIRERIASGTLSPGQLDGYITDLGNIQEQIKSLIEVPPEFIPPPSKDSSKVDKWKEEFENLYSDLKYNLDKGIIDAEKFYKELNKLNDKYFKDQKNGKYKSEYRQYELESIEGLRTEYQRQYDERLELSKNWIKRQRERNNLSVEDEIAAWERVKAYTRKYYADAIKAAKNNKTLKLQLEKELANKIMEFDDSIFEAKKRAMEEQVKLYEDEQDSISELIKQTEELIKFEKEGQKKVYEGRKKNLEALKAEQDYKDSITKKTKTLADLEYALKMAERDTTESGLAKQIELRQSIADLKGEIADEEAQNEYDLKQEALDKEIESIDKYLDKTGQLTADAMKRIEKDIKNGTTVLKDELIAWNRTYGTSIDSDITKMWDKAKSGFSRFSETIKTSGLAAAIKAIADEIANLNKQLGQTEEVPTTGQMTKAQAAQAGADARTRLRATGYNGSGITELDNMNDVQARAWYNKWIVTHKTLTDEQKGLFLDIVEAKEAWTKAQYANGGFSTKTQIATLHGTQSSPEWIFNNDQLKTLLASAVYNTRTSPMISIPNAGNIQSPGNVQSNVTFDFANMITINGNADGSTVQSLKEASAEIANVVINKINNQLKLNGQYVLTSK